MDNATNEPVLASTSGLILHIQAREAVSGRDVHFNFRVRDLSRKLSTWGTELPVVRDSQLTSSAIQLLNIPIDPAFRFTVRIYALEGLPPIRAVVRAYDFGTGKLQLELPIALDRLPDQSPIYYPAYAQLDSLSDQFVGLTSDRVNIEISPSQPGQRLWAFASITNNDTQHVTVVTPD